MIFQHVREKHLPAKKAVNIVFFCYVYREFQVTGIMGRFVKRMVIWRD